MLSNINQIYAPSTKPMYHMDHCITVIEEFPELDEYAACSDGCAQITRVSVVQNQNVIEELSDIPLIWKGNWVYNPVSKTTEWTSHVVLCDEHVPVNVVYDEHEECMVFKTVSGEHVALVHVADDWNVRRNHVLQFKTKDDARHMADILTHVFAMIQSKRVFNEPSIEYVISQLNRVPELPFVYAGRFYGSRPLVAVAHGNTKAVFAGDDPAWKSLVSHTIIPSLLLDIEHDVSKQL